VEPAGRAWLADLMPCRPDRPPQPRWSSSNKVRIAARLGGVPRFAKLLQGLTQLVELWPDLSAEPLAGAAGSLPRLANSPPQPSRRLRGSLCGRSRNSSGLRSWNSAGGVLVMFYLVVSFLSSATLRGRLFGR
jgi:hypothetical protein